MPHRFSSIISFNQLLLFDAHSLTPTPITFTSQTIIYQPPISLTLAVFRIFCLQI
jgi:hypothetical protein